MEQNEDLTKNTTQWECSHFNIYLGGDRDNMDESVLSENKRQRLYQAFLGVTSLSRMVILWLFKWRETEPFTIAASER